MKQEELQIKGRRIHPGNLEEIARKWSGDPDIPAFLRSWYDHKSTFPAYTSGSTGSPNRINLQKKYAAASARATIQFLGLKSGQTALLSMPVKFIAGKMMIIRALTGRLNLIPIPPATIPHLPDQTIDLAAFTPHQFRNLIRSGPDIRKMNLENVLLGGAPYPHELTDELEGFQGRIFETFGMTETYSHIALRQRWPIEDPSFRAMPGVSFDTRDNHLIIKAPHIGVDALQTNDIVQLEGPDRFHWLGRADFVINSGGIKIHPEAVEKKLSGLIPGPFFITGQQDDEFGEKTILVIEKDEKYGSDQAILKQFDQILERYEKPKSIIWVDTMIYTPSGKINRLATKNFYRI